MKRFFYENFQEYLKENGVRKIDFILKDNECLSMKGMEQRVNKQLEVISQFHQKSCGFNGCLKYRINNDTCKLIEECKIHIKRLKKDLQKIKESGCNGKVEQFIDEYGPIYLQRAEECIRNIYNSNYIKLISRSMDKVEICLTDVGFDNLQYDNEIKIVNFYDIAYNMVEMDAYYLLSKLKRKGIKLDWKEHINKFCEFEGLTKSSGNFILALMSYPHEFMKVYEKYKKNKKNWSEDDYIRKLRKAIGEDGESLLNLIDVN